MSRTPLLFVAMIGACEFPRPSDVRDDAGGSGDGGGGGDAYVADTPIDAVALCNFVEQTGCAPSDRCAWLLDSLNPVAGHFGCAPNTGAIADDQPCTYGAPGANGYDNCTRGAVCDDTCKRPCDPTVPCASSHACAPMTSPVVRPSQLLLCAKVCNPLEDNDFDGSGADTKDASNCPSGSDFGCYGFPSYGKPPATAFYCAREINYNNSLLRHRAQCTSNTGCANTSGTGYVNGCNQGYVPVLRESTGVATMVCTALCKPSTCYSGACGTANANRAGIAPHRCNTVDRVGTFSMTEHCVHLWRYEVDAQQNFLPSPTSDSVGICWDPKKYNYDSNNDGQTNGADQLYPTCDQLGSGFGAGSNPAIPTTYFGAADLGCVPTTYLMATSGDPPLNARVAPSRVDLPRALYRRSAN